MGCGFCVLFLDEDFVLLLFWGFIFGCMWSMVMGMFEICEIVLDYWVCICELL